MTVEPKGPAAIERMARTLDRYQRLFAIWALGMWLFFAQEAAAVAFGMHLGLNTATNTKRDLSIVRMSVLLIRRPIGGVPALMEIMAQFVGNKRWG